MGTNIRRFRCAAVPGWYVPPLAAPRSEIEEVVVKKPWGPLAIRYVGRVVPAELPEDFVLIELRELDFSEEAFREGRTLRAVVEFMRRYGELDVGSRRRIDFQPVADPAIPKRAIARDGISTIECARLLHLAQCLARHWVAYKDDVPVFDVWHGSQIAPPVINEGIAWSAFTWHLNEGLRLLAPHVDYWSLDSVGTDDVNAPGPQEDIDPDEVIDVREVPDLFDALCVQLYRIITEDLKVGTCENESCRKRFTKQRGTAKAGQHRTRGVMYCSRSCAWTQRSRERRRKLRNQEL